MAFYFSNLILQTASLNQKGKEINRKLDNYIDETNKLYENIRKLQKDYNVPNKLIIP